MVEYFKQEMFKLKSANYLLRSDIAALRESNQHLAEHNLSLEASHSALKQNVTKMSQSNMRLALNNSEQKDTISKLKQDLKMEKIRGNSEIKSLQEQLKDNDRQHENEMNRMRREMERLRKIIAKTPGSGKAPLNRSAKGADGSGMPRVGSMENMSVTSTLASSEEEWGHDAFLERSKPSRSDPANWTVVKKRDRRPRKPRSSQTSYGRRFSGDGPRGSGSRGKYTSTRTEETPKKYSSPTNKPMPNSSLAAAANLTPSPSPANSRPNSRPTSRASSRANSPVPPPNSGGHGRGGGRGSGSYRGRGGGRGGGGGGGSRRGSMGRGSMSTSNLKSPPPSGNTPRRTLSQSSLGSKGKEKTSSMQRTNSQGNIDNSNTKQ